MWGHSMNQGFRFGLALGLSIFCLFTGNAWGWGGVGHNAVALIAEKTLSPRSQQELRKIMGTDTLAQLSIWPDQIKRQAGWQHTALYHYAGVPDSQSYLDYFAHRSAQLTRRGDVVLALIKAEKNLSDARLSVADRKSALAFLVHLVGDLHQPFHSGREEDRGGNDIRFRWFGRMTNLHAVWDSSLIEKSYFAKLLSLSDLEKAKLYVAEIDQSTEAQRISWLQGTYTDWIRESVEARIPAYGGYSNQQEWYRETYIELVNLRILAAGYRLGNLLNLIFDLPQSKAEPQAVENIGYLDQELQGIAGPDYLSNIHLSPISAQKTREILEATFTPGDAWLFDDCAGEH